MSSRFRRGAFGTSAENSSLTPGRSFAAPKYLYPPDPNHLLIYLKVRYIVYLEAPVPANQAL